MKKRITKLISILTILLCFIANVSNSQKPYVIYPSGNQTFPIGLPMSVSPNNIGGVVPSYNYRNIGQITYGSSAYLISGIAYGVRGTNYNYQSNNTVIADATNNRILIGSSNYFNVLAGVGTKGYADGVGTAAKFNTPAGITYSPNDNSYIYVADAGNHCIRKIYTYNGTVTTLAGTATIAGSTDATGLSASFNNPTGLTSDGSYLYVADAGNNTIRKISISAYGGGGVVTTLAGSAGVAGSSDGKGGAASFNNPTGIVYYNGKLYVADNGNNKIRVIDNQGNVTTLAGSGISGSADGLGTAASFKNPYDITVAFGNLFITDAGNNSIRKITLDGTVSTFISNNNNNIYSYNTMKGITFDNAGNIMFSAINNIYTQNYTYRYGYIYTTGVVGYELIPATLPQGLSFNTSNGIISGTPVYLSPTTNYTINAYNQYGSYSTSVNLAINSGTKPSISYGTSSVSLPISTTITTLTPTNTGGAIPVGNSNIMNWAGNGTSGLLNGTGVAANFYQPNGMVTDVNGNIYTADAANNVIRKIDPQRNVSTFAGSGLYGTIDATGNQASFNNPVGLAINPAGNTLYVADANNNLIRKISLSGVVTTIAGTGVAGSTDGQGTSASLNHPTGVVADSKGNLFVVDQLNQVIRKIDINGNVITYVGTLGIKGSTDANSMLSASFNNPTSIAIDINGNLYVTDAGNNKIRIIDTANHIVSTFAGNGLAANVDDYCAFASFNNPTGITIDLLGNIFVTDAGNKSIRKISGGQVITIVSGTTTPTAFTTPAGVCTDNVGNIYVSDISLNTIQKITQYGFTITPQLPQGLLFDITSGSISGITNTVTPATNYTITAYNAAGYNSITLSIATTGSAPVISYPTGTQMYPLGIPVSPLNVTNTGGDITGNYYGTSSTFAGTASGYGYQDGTNSKFNNPAGMAVDVNTGNIFVADARNNVIRKITPAGIVSTYAGIAGSTGAINGSATVATFNNPTSIAIDANGFVYVADAGNNVIRKIAMVNNVLTVSTYAGIAGTTGVINGAANISKFNNPTALSLNPQNDTLYVADAGNNLIRKIFLNSGVLTVSNYSNIAGLNNPTGVVSIDNKGTLFVVDKGNNVIRKMTPLAAPITYAGTAGSTAKSVDGNRLTQALFNAPISITKDIMGNLFITENGLNIRRIDTLTGLVTTLGSTYYSNYNGYYIYDNGFVTADALGNIYVSSTLRNIILKVIQWGYYITPSLPDGLVMDANTGIISGTPNVVSGAIKYTISAYNSVGMGSTTVTIQVNTGSKPAFSYPGTPFTLSMATPITSVSPNHTGGAIPNKSYGKKIVFAGTGVAGFLDNVPALSAQFYGSSKVAIGKSGNMYVADRNNQVIRKIDASTGKVTIYAGVQGISGTTDNVTALSANFNSPTYVIVDNSENVYVSDAGNQVIRKIDYLTKMVSTVAGTMGISGDATSSNFSYPNSICIEPDGTSLYVADNNYVIKRVDISTKVVTTLYGSGTNSTVFSSPQGLSLDKSHNLFICDTYNEVIREIVNAKTATSTSATIVFAGITGNYGTLNGQRTTATFSYPKDVYIDTISGNTFVLDNSGVRKIDNQGYVTLLYTGTGSGINTDIFGNIYLADGSSTINKIVQWGFTVTPPLPDGLLIDSSTGIISGTPVSIISATNYAVTAYNAAGFATTTINVKTNAGNVPIISYSSNNLTLPIGTSVNIPIINTGGAIPAKIYNKVETFAGTGSAGSVDGAGTNATFSSPNGMVTDAAGNIFVADRNNSIIRKITPSGVVSTYAGIKGSAGYKDGAGNVAQFNYPSGLAIDKTGNIYVADAYNNVIRLITNVGGVITVSTIAGDNVSATAGNVGNTTTGVSAASARFNYPTGVAVYDNGTNVTVYIADFNNNCIKKLYQGNVSLFAGSTTGTSGYATGAATTVALFNHPVSVAVDATGSNVYVADQSNYVISVINTGNSTVSAFAGTNNVYGAVDAVGVLAQFQTITSITYDPNGYLLVADGNVIRRVAISSKRVQTIAGTSSVGKVNDLGYLSSFSSPRGIALFQGTIYVGDANNNLIRTINQWGFTLSSPLPEGLNFDTLHGTISGTPTFISPSATYTVTAYNAAGSGSYSFNLSTTGFPPTITSSSNAVTFPIGSPISPVTNINSGGSIPTQQFGTVSTYMIGINNGFLNYLAYNPPFGYANYYYSYSNPKGIVMDKKNGYIYVCTDNVIKRIDKQKNISIFAGNSTAGYSDGTGSTAKFYYPEGLTIDTAGNIYVADRYNHLIRKVTPAGVVSTIAGKSGTSGTTDGDPTKAALFYYPTGVAVDKNLDLYVADQSNSSIRKIAWDPNSKTYNTVSTIAGISGSSGNAEGITGVSRFNNPYGIVIDTINRLLYVSDTYNQVIRKIDLSGNTTTYAPVSCKAITIDTMGNLFVSSGGTISKVDIKANVTQIAGGGSVRDGIGTAASFSSISNLTTDTIGNIYATDNNSIRKITQWGYSVVPALPKGLSIDTNTGIISGTPIVAGFAANYAVLACNGAGCNLSKISITTNNGAAPKISYTGPQQYPIGSAITALLPSNSGGAVPSNPYANVKTYVTGKFNSSEGVALGANGIVYLASAGGYNINRIDISGNVTNYAGSGYGNIDAQGSSAKFGYPNGIAIDAGGNIFVSDRNNYTIRKIDITGNVTTYAGKAGTYGSADGAGTSATFSSTLNDIAIDRLGNLYIADGNKIRKIDNSRNVTTLAGIDQASYADGIGTTAMFNNITGITVDANGNIYVADQGNYRIRKVTPSGNVSTIAGSGTTGNTDGMGTIASLNPYKICVDLSGNLYITDNYNYRGKVRKITPLGIVSTIAGCSINYSLIDGIGTDAGFTSSIAGIAVDTSGNLYVGDGTALRKISQWGYMINPILPEGLVFDASFGTISGTPNTVSSAIYTITAYNAAGSNSTKLTISTVQPPTINSFTPSSGNPGSSITIIGTGFLTATSVSFGGTNASSFSIIDDNTIIAIVGNGASGIIKVTSANGTAQLDGFSYCNSILSPRVTITTSSNNICAGSSVNFTAIPFNGGSDPGYQWYRNSNYISSGITYTDAGLNNNDVIYCTLISNASCLSNNKANSNTIIVQVDTTPSKPVITSNNTTLLTGSTLSLKANSSSLTGIVNPISYHWIDPINNQTNAQNLVVNNISSVNAGVYKVYSSNTCGVSQYSTITISVSPVTSNKYTLYMDKITCVGGSNSIVSIRVKNFNAVTGIQGTIKWDTAILRYNSIIKTSSIISLDSLSTINNSQSQKDGLLTFNWYDASLQGQTLADGSAIFKIKFWVKKNTTITPIAFVNTPTNLEVDVINSISGNATTGLPVTSIDTSFIAGSIDTRNPLLALNPTYNVSPIIGDTLKLFAVNNVGASYTWTGPNGHTFYGNNDTIINTNLNNEGLYTVFATKGTCTISDTITVQLIKSFGIKGVARYPSGSPINGVSFNITNGTVYSSFLSSANGNYIFNSAPRYNYILTPSKSNDINVTNGVSVIDIALLQSHILNKVTLNSPYKLMAADVDNNNTISVMDIVYMKRLILGLDLTFPSNRLWAFVDSNYNFPNVNNPFPYPSNDTFNNLLSDKLNRSFIGVKLGDVNYDWNPLLAKGQQKANVPVELYYDDINITSTDKLAIPIKVKHFKQIKAMQFALHFNADVFDLVSIQKDNIDIDYSIAKSNKGIITILWNESNAEDLTLADGTTLFSLILNKKDKIKKEEFSLLKDEINMEAWDKNYQLHNIVLQKGIINEKVAMPIVESIHFSPNPCKGIITLNINSNDCKTARLTIDNNSGKAVFEKSIMINKGNQSLKFNLNEYTKLSSGLYYINIEGLNKQYIEKLIITE